MNALKDSVDLETVVARLTPAIPSAIATIAVQGPSAVDIVAKLVRLKHSTGEVFSLGRVRYGLWNPANDDHAAEQVVVCRTDPNMRLRFTVMVAMPCAN